MVWVSRSSLSDTETYDVVHDSTRVVIDECHGFSRYELNIVRVDKAMVLYGLPFYQAIETLPRFDHWKVLTECSAVSKNEKSLINFPHLSYTLLAYFTRRFGAIRNRA